MTAPSEQRLRLFLIAGEHSGDALGGRLIEAMRRLSQVEPEIAGLGGEAMAAQGLASLFPLSDVAVMGPLAIARRLPTLLRRVRQTVDAAVAFRPDALVIIDSPEFTHPIAKRVRKRLPGLPVVDYVSPSVWAWRPGRARRMVAYVDHVLALLPFEPEAHRRLGGPACTYVGHPFVERVAWMRSLDSAELGRRLGLDPARPVVVVLPGSRASEVGRLMEPFGAALGRLEQRHGPLEVLIPAVPHVRPQIEAELARWPVRAHLLAGEEDKFRAFRLARAALAASGTVTLELALAGTPMVVAYKVDAVAARLRFLLKTHSVVLANLVLGVNAFPELLQEQCTPERLAEAMSAILAEGPARQAQFGALAAIDAAMGLGPAGSVAVAPSDRAAQIVLELARKGVRRHA